jgi:hypothetical protein
MSDLVIAHEENANACALLKNVCPITGICEFMAN